MARVKKGDTVYVLSGKDKGKTGKVLQVFPESDKALVEKINLMKNFDRPSQVNQSGGVVERETPVRMCKLALVTPKTLKPTRIGHQVSKDGSKIRVSRRTGEALDQK
jgi:large subunit ribosomal protein L24